MEHEAVIEYMCPRCGAHIRPDEQRCPGCSAIVDWLDEHGAMGAGHDDAAPTGVAAATIEEPPSEDVGAPAVEDDAEASATAGRGGWKEFAASGDRSAAAISEPEATSGPFGFLYSNVGAIAFAVMLVAFVGTMLVLRWDTWVGGAEVETIGRLQLLAGCMGIATIIVTGSIGVWDALRSARA